MLTRLQRYNSITNSYDLLKGCAIIFSIGDHIGLYFLQDDPEWAIVGRLAAPLFFFIAGYSSSLQVRSSIWIYGLILTVFVYYFEGYGIYFNILLSIGLCKLFLSYFQPKDKSWQWLLLLFVLLWLTQPWSKTYIEYGSMGLAYAVCGYLVRQQIYKQLLPILLITTLLVHFSDYFISYQEIHQSLMLCTIVLILFLSMWFFSFRTFNLPPGTSWLFMFTGRYSLEIYVGHVLLFSFIYQNFPAYLNLEFWGQYTH